MIDVLIDDARRIVTVKGHAGYDAKGKDIVCSSVSSVVQFVVCCLTNANELHQCEMDDGNALIEFGIDEISDTLYDTFKAYLQSMQANYPKYVSVDFA